MSVLSSRLAPGFIRIRYSGFTQPHTQVIPIKFAFTPTAGLEPTLSTADGTELLFEAAVTAYMTAAFRGQFDTATQIGFADIYSVNSVTGVRTFIYTTNIGLAGTSTDPNVALVEGVYMFKTSVGKPLKVYVMEGTWAANVRNVGTVPNDARQDMLDYVLSDANIIYGRDDAWPLAFMTFTSKVNDVLRRRDGLVNF